ncbi:MAG TPA: NUDIX domain-containing protein [Chloroflexaceae bacterium]|nr:NUDIX domain-containing protein [Chloroflexaceae bacterium]
MNHVLHGLREGALTITYNLYLAARAAGRRLTAPTAVGVRVIAPRGDEVLLVRHRGGRFPWSLPGGGVGRHESLADSAVRELREEGGCPAEVAYLHGLYHSFGEGMNNFIAIFVCTPLGEARPPAADLEIVDARFFPARDLPATLDPGSRRRLEEFARGERGVSRPW